MKELYDKVQESIKDSFKDFIQSYYEHIPPTGLGLILLGDLTTIWETPETSNDDFWKNQEDWEIIRWRLNESSGVHTLELEDGTMIHMLAERRYPLSRELMIRMLDHGMEVEDERDLKLRGSFEDCFIHGDCFVISNKGRLLGSEI
ncbi:hypothetical protein Tco_0130115 [Tanacetum coccineum]